MTEETQSYTFPWGFHLGDLSQGRERIPLYTPSNDGGFCLLYDKASEKQADDLIESLCLELLSSMPYEHLKVKMFDFGKKKFYHLSPLQYIHLYHNSHNTEMIEQTFQTIEELVVSRHTDLLCCNRKTIDEHNQKSKLKQGYQLLLINLENFPSQDFSLRRIQNFVESAQKAGVYVIAFGNQSIQESQNPNVQAILKYFKTIKVTNNVFDINVELFEFMELLETHTFAPLSLNKPELLQSTLTKADLEQLMNPENIKLESDTKV
ncbi:MAG: hypothetical protein Q9M36_11310 [Sulfurovum sp.]|nr:hypothetical protein [Sulfurovum sp.]